MVEFPFTASAVTAVVMGASIPAHDETLELAEEIGRKLDEFQHYVEEVRGTFQAKEAVRELLTVLLSDAG